MFITEYRSASCLLQYEDHFKLLLEEALADEQQLFAAAVLEPYSEESRRGPASPGSLVEGETSMLSCGCICKVNEGSERGGEPPPPPPPSSCINQGGRSRIGSTWAHHKSGLGHLTSFSLCSGGQHQAVLGGILGQSPRRGPRRTCCSGPGTGSVTSFWEYLF